MVTQSTADLSLLLRPELLNGNHFSVRYKTFSFQEAENDIYFVVFTARMMNSCFAMEPTFCNMNFQEHENFFMTTPSTGMILCCKPLLFFL